MGDTPGDQLADALAAHASSGSRAEAGRLRAAIQRSQASGRSEVRALPLGKQKAPPAPKEPLFTRARPLSELLNDFKDIHAEPPSATVAPLSSASSSSSSSSSAHAHVPHPPISTEFDQTLLSRYMAERVVHMSGLVAQTAPSPSKVRRIPLDTAYVRRLLSEPYGGFTSCTNKVCIGFSLPGRFALMAYASPEQMQHYDLTGQVPVQQSPMCYLCALSTLTTAVDLAASAKSGLRTIQAPFFHPINCPGGYVASAMHRSVMFGTALSITHPIRHVDLSEFVLDERNVYVPEEGAPLNDAGWTTKWVVRTVRGYSERADLMFGANYVPAITQLAAPVRIIGVGELPPCERLLADKFITAASLSHTPLATVENASVNALHLPLPLISSLGGPTHAQETLQVSAPGAHFQQVVWTLCWSDIMVARARLIHLINQAGNNVDAVAQKYLLLPVDQKHFVMSEPHAIQARYAFKLHMIFYLTLMRLNEIARLLDTSQGVPRQLGNPPTHGEPDMVTRALHNPGVAEQLKAYQASLQPLLEFFMHRMRLGTAIDDTVFFQPGERVVRWFELRPAPAPDYFSPNDLTNYPLDVAPITSPTPGSVAAAGMNSLPPADRGAAPMVLYPGVFDDFWESVATLHAQMPTDQAPCMAYWQPQADDVIFHLTADVAVKLEQVCEDEERDFVEWTNRLQAALRGQSSIWRAVVYRINVASWLIQHTTARLAALDKQLTAIGDRANAWLPLHYTSQLAVRIHAEHAKATTHLALNDLIDVVMRDMPDIANDATLLLEEHRRLTAFAQALKQFVASHVPLVCAAIIRGAIDDNEMREVTTEHLPTPFGAPGSVCDETMMCLASEVDNIEFLNDMPESSLYSWVMSAAVPTSARASDLVARHREAMNLSEEYAQFARQVLYAHLTGAYPHARNVAPFHVWVNAHLMLFAAPNEVSRAAIDFYMDECVVENPASDQTESNERIFALVLREHFVRTLELAPAHRMLVMANYLAYPQFSENVRRHAEQSRSVASQCSLHTTNAVLLETYAKTSQPWPTYHRPPVSFPAFMAECCKQVDIDRAIDACEKARAVLGNDELRPPVDAIRGIGAYVESNVLSHELYREKWMTDVGLSAEGIAVINRLYAEHKGRAVNVSQGIVKLGRLAAQRPIDYQIVSIFFSVMQLHIKRRVVPLDLEIAFKQQDALHQQRNMAGVSHAGECVLSSVQCCDTMRTFVIQDGTAFQGTLPMRLNLNTNKSVCVPKRGKGYTPNRPMERESAGLNVRGAIKSYFELYDSPTRTELDNGELQARRTLMRDALRSHVQTLSKGRYSLPCGTMEVIRWPAVGYITLHGDQSCTVCPKCGNKTAYSPGMFSSNMFTCGSCDKAMDDALQRAQDDRCALCLQTPKAVSRAMRVDNSDRRGYMRDATVELLDDTAAPDVMTYRKAWVCALCNSERWLASAANAFTLSELRWLRGHQDVFKRQLAELKDPVDWEVMRRDFARAKASPNVQFPSIHSVHAIPKQRRIKRRLGAQHV